MNEVAIRLAARLFDQRLIQNQFRSTYIEAMIEPYLVPDGWSYASGMVGADGSLNGAKTDLRLNSPPHTKLGPKPETFKHGVPSILPLGPATFLKAVLNTRQSRRCAQTYVFAWNPIYGAETDHRNPDQWEF